MISRFFFFVCVLSFASTLQACSQSVTKKNDLKIITGAEQLDLLLPKIHGKKVALLVNYTATIGNRHLADTLKSLHADLKKIFAPEHGFRGGASAGELVTDGADPKTGLFVASLYGDHRKPTAAQLADVDVVVFDIQDVGVRFYTYISTLHYMMEACAEQNKKIIILDRPNPNAGYTDGPVLEPEFTSFVGMHPIPIAYGMTVGELAQMINGEGWLKDGKKCDVEVIRLRNYTHKSKYSLPIRPSPNLPNDHAILLYPSTCLFEGTVLSIGRGTQNPFEVMGHPVLKDQPYQFTPVDLPGMASHPPFENKVCYGLDLRQETPADHISLKHLIDLYQLFPEKDKFFIPYFERLAGTATLRRQIMQGLTEDQIRQSWQPALEAFKIQRKKYLIYE